MDFRSTKSLIAAVAAGALAFAMPAHAQDTIEYGGRTYYGGTAVLAPSPDSSVPSVFAAVATAGPKVTCRPTNPRIILGDLSAQPFTPNAQPYDMLYRWHGDATASFDGCEGYVVYGHVQITDQQLDGVSAFAQSPPGNAQAVSKRDANGHVGATANAQTAFDVYYPVAGATSLHQITLRGWGEYSKDGATKVPMGSRCRTWTYKATPLGPVFVGSTPEADCGA